MSNNSIKKMYHLSYDIINSENNYQDKKDKLINLILSTEPKYAYSINESSILLEYNTDFDLMKFIKKELKDKNYKIFISRIYKELDGSFEYYQSI